MYYPNEFYSDLVQKNIINTFVILSFSNESFENLVSVVFDTVIGSSFTEAVTISDKIAKITYHYKVSIHYIENTYMMDVEIFIE